MTPQPPNREKTHAQEPDHRQPRGGNRVAVASPASAATDTFQDATGDAPAPIDLTAVKVDNGANTVKGVPKFDNLRKARLDTAELKINLKSGEFYTGRLNQRADGTFKPNFYEEDDTPPSNACGGLSITIDGDRIDFVVPQSGVGDNDKTITTFAQTVDTRRAEDDHDLLSEDGFGGPIPYN
ncbi:MAG: hypothetical protein ACR2JU_05255 [Nocardioidaceae bacterium]